MSLAVESEPIASDRDKLHWEIKKLQAETEAMRRPAYLSPSTLVPIITGLVALFGASFEHQKSILEAEKAAFRVEQAQSKLESLRGAETELLRHLDELKAENDGAATRLATLRAELAKAEEGIRTAAASASTAEAQTALSEARSTVATLQKATSDSEKARAERAVRLGAMRARASRP